MFLSVGFAVTAMTETVCCLMTANPTAACSLSADTLSIATTLRTPYCLRIKNCMRRSPTQQRANDVSSALRISCKSEEPEILPQMCREAKATESGGTTAQKTSLTVTLLTCRIRLVTRLLQAENKVSNTAIPYPPKTRDKSVTKKSERR